VRAFPHLKRISFWSEPCPPRGGGWLFFGRRVADDRTGTRGPEQHLGSDPQNTFLPVKIPPLTTWFSKTHLKKPSSIACHCSPHLYLSVRRAICCVATPCSASHSKCRSAAPETPEHARGNARLLPTRRLLHRGLVKRGRLGN